MKLITTIARKIIVPKLFSRFSRNEEGVTAVEFAMVGGPFFFLVFAILESSLLFFATQHLETSIDNVTRKIRTGILNELTTEDDFKDAICEEVVVIIKCDEIKTKVRVLVDFADIEEETIDEEGNLEDGFPTLGQERIVQVTAIYEFPVYTNFVSPLRFRDQNFSLIHVTAITRTEPFGLVQNPTGSGS